MVFIDGNNFYHDWKQVMGDSNPDIQRFVDLAVGKKDGRTLKRIFYYNAPIDRIENPSGAENQQRFFTALGNIPRLNKVLGRLERRSIRIGASGYNVVCNHCGKLVEGEVHTHTEKGSDINLAIDMLIQAYSGNFDVALLVSRDSDFIRAIEEVRRHGEDVEVVVLPGLGSRELREAADDQIALSREECQSCEVDPLRRFGGPETRRLETNEAAR